MVWWGGWASKLTATSRGGVQTPQARVTPSRGGVLTPQAQVTPFRTTTLCYRPRPCTLSEDTSEPPDESVQSADEGREIEHHRAHTVSCGGGTVARSTIRPPQPTPWMCNAVAAQDRLRYDLSLTHLVETHGIKYEVCYP